MAQDEKMLVSVEPTDAMVEAAYEHWLNKTGDAGRYVVRNIIKAALSAAPAQPAAGEGAAALKPLFTAVDFADEYNKSGRPKRTAKDYFLDSELRAAVAYLRAHPSPTPAAEAASRNNVTSGDEVWVKAKASDVCTSCCGVCIPTIHERDVNTYVHWSSVSLSPTPAADDALRVAVEALEPFERMWAEHGDFPPTDDRHAWGFNGADLYWGDFRRAAEALAALKAEKK